MALAQKQKYRPMEQDRKPRNKPTYWGPAPVGSRDILRRTALAIGRIDKRRKTERLDLTHLHGKLIKFVTPNLL